MELNCIDIFQRSLARGAVERNLLPLQATHQQITPQSEQRFIYNRMFQAKAPLMKTRLLDLFS